MLEAGPSLANSWRNHYDRLHLHTVKQQSNLPGLPFAKELPRYVSRADFVAYLESYAARFSIAPRTGEAVRRVRRGGRRVRRRERPRRLSGARRGRRHRIQPRAESGAAPRAGAVSAARSCIRPATATARRSPGQRVLVVGAGNTGAEIALDLAERGAKPTLAVRAPVNVVPRDLLGMPIQLTSIRLRQAPLELADGIGRLASRLAFGNLARLGFPRPAMGPISAIKLRRRIPLIDVGTIAAIKRGAIAVKPGVARLTETGAVFADGSAAELDAVVLATGFRAALEELVAVPGVLDDSGSPRDWRGGGACPNLFFVGYEIVPTGHLREIAIRAEAVAAEIAGAGRHRD